MKQPVASNHCILNGEGRICFERIFVLYVRETAWIGGAWQSDLHLRARCRRDLNET